MAIIYNETRFSDFSFRYKWFSPFQISCTVVLVVNIEIIVFIFPFPLMSY